MQTAFTLPLQSGRLKENQGAVALRTAMRGTKPFRRADETTLKPARAMNRSRLTQLTASLQFAPNVKSPESHVERS
jgi:hypothetical protein